MTIAISDSILDIISSSIERITSDSVFGCLFLCPESSSYTRCTPCRLTDPNLSVNLGTSRLHIFNSVMPYLLQFYINQ